MIVLYCILGMMWWEITFANTSEQSKLLATKSCEANNYKGIKENIPPKMSSSLSSETANCSILVANTSKISSDPDGTSESLPPASAPFADCFEGEECRGVIFDS